MRMHDRVDVGTVFIHAHVHFDFRRRIELAFELSALAVDLDDHIGRERTFGNARGRAVIFVGTDFNGNVSVVRGNEIFCIELMPYLADFLLDFKRRFHSVTIPLYDFYFFMLWKAPTYRGRSCIPRRWE